MSPTFPLTLEGATLQSLSLEGVRRTSDAPATVDVRLGLSVPLEVLTEALEALHNLAGKNQDMDEASEVGQDKFRPIHRTATAPARTTTTYTEGSEEEEEANEIVNDLPPNLPPPSHPFDRTMTQDPFYQNEWGVPDMGMPGLHFPGFDPWMHPHLASNFGVGGPTPGFAFQQTWPEMSPPPPPLPPLPEQAQDKSPPPLPIGPPAGLPAPPDLLRLTSAPKEQPDSLEDSFDLSSEIMRFKWTTRRKKVDAALEGTLTSIKSPPFELTPSSSTCQLPLVMELEKAPADAEKKTASEQLFRLKLCCASELKEPPSSARLVVDVRVSNQSLLKQPLVHDFATSPAVNLGSVDVASAMINDSLAICLEVLCNRERVQELTVAEAPASPPSASRQLVVKNTFIDFQEVGSRAMDLIKRTVTAPVGGAAAAAASVAGLGGFELIEEEAEHPSTLTSSNPSMPSESAAVQGSANSPPPVALLAPIGPPGQSQVLRRSFDTENSRLQVEWVVSAKKLTSSDTHSHVSPAFELSCGDQMPKATFKLMIAPLVVSDKKGGGSFKKAQGRGYISLACEDELPRDVPKLTFWLSIGAGDKKSSTRGPVEHSFAEKTVCGLPKKQALWDFTNAVDRTSQTFIVRLEVETIKAAANGNPASAEPVAGASDTLSKPPAARRW